MMERPNFLWLVSEDNSPEYIGAYGPQSRTPRLDRLASEGVVYDNCYATAPVCAPSRFSIITGMYATSFAPANHMRADGNIPDDAAADLAAHNRAQSPAGRRYLDNLPSWVRGFPAYLRDVGYYCTNSAKQDYNAPIDVRDTWDDSSTSAHWRNRPDGASFFAVFNYHVTHESRLHPGRAEPLPDGFAPADIQLPAYHPDLPELRADRSLYYDQNTKLDAELAEVLAELDADGLREDTIVFYYADHGGSTPRSKRFCYDSGLRVPLIVRVPPKWQHLWPAQPGTRIVDLVSLIDLAPTMMQLAGLEAADYMTGQAFAGPQLAEPRQYAFAFRNRMDERYDMVRSARDRQYRYIRNYMPHLPGGQHVEYLFTQPGAQAWHSAYQEGRLNAVQAAFWQERPPQELYDLIADPDEVDNLAELPKYAAVLRRMRHALDEHMLRTRDNGFIPEGSELEGYDPASDSQAYPLERVIAVANLASERDPGNLAQLIEWLTDDVEPVRYWAALGCVMLREQSVAARETLAARLDDDAPPVRIAAAEALCWIGDADKGLPVLELLTLKHEHPRVRLQAINALDNLGEIAHPVWEVYVKARNDTNQEVAKVARHAVAS